jgi:UV DNA damage endonuclease
MAIGNCCLLWGIYHTNYQTIKLSSVTESRLKEIIEYNLESLDNAINFSIENKIKFFRLSSDIIPFGSNPVNKIKWHQLYKKQLTAIGEKIIKAKMRVSFHPGQYCVLNSPDIKVVKNTVKDLEFHALFLDSLGLDYTHKMVIHIGGVYGDKQSAIKRFATNFKLLSKSAQNRLIIENDDKSYHTEDALKLSAMIGAPVVYDNFHNSILTSDKSISDYEWIKRCAKTWKSKDGRPKTHFSTQQADAIKGTHSHRVLINEFIPYYEKVKELDVDYMLEVKDKNISSIKLINIIENNGDKTLVEKDFKRFYYWLLSIDQEKTVKLEAQLKSSKFNATQFYLQIEKLIVLERSNEIKALKQMIDVEYKDISKEDLKVILADYDKVKEKYLSVATFKEKIYQVAIKYQINDVLNSYIFND